MKKLACAAAIAAVVAGAGLKAVTFGAPDGNAHPYVGAIIFQTASGFFSCSATLMSPTVLLTAGHCTEEGGAANLNTWAKFTPKISLAGRENYPSLGAFLDDTKNGWIKGNAVPHPQFDDFSAFPQTFDVGVVLLKQGVSMKTFGALPPKNFLETIRSAQENSFTAVGYGLQGLIKPFFSDRFERFAGTVKLIELKSTFDGGQSAKFSNNPGTDGGTCFGDSGGPVFYGSTNMVTAITSFGITPCIGVDYQFRIDTEIALSFLRQFIK